MNKSHSRDYWILSGFLFSLFICYAFVYAMYAIWLSQAAALSGRQIGILFSVNAAAAISIQPLLGFIQDRIKAGQHLLWLNVATLMATAPFMVFVYKPLLMSNFAVGAAVGAVFIAMVFLAIAGAVETYIERISRFNELEFGQVRTWGSLGWAAASFFTGILINIDPDLNFWFASGFALIPLCILLFVRIPVSEKAVAAFERTDKVRFSDVLQVLRIRDFRYLAVFTFGVSGIYVIYDQQFPVFFASMYSSVELGNEMYGYLNSAQIFLEAGFFFLAPFIVSRIGTKNGLLLAGAIMLTRILGSALVESTVLISVIKLLHAIELPVLMVSVFKYLNLHFDARLSSTLYLIGFAFVTQSTTILFAPLAGHFYDEIGFTNTYLGMAVFAGLFLLLSARTLLADDKALANKE